MKSRKQKNEPIPLKIILMVIIALAIIMYYLSIPSKKVVAKGKSFEEQLEYSRSNTYHTRNAANEEVEVYIPQRKVKVLEPTSADYYQNNRNISQPQNKPQKVATNQTNTTSSTKNYINREKDYKKLLDELQGYPTQSLSYIQRIVNRFLEFKGYPANTVKVVNTDINQDRAKTKGNYLVANFDFASGNMNISNAILYSLDKQSVIAILAHELDHFDKLACVCKHMGVNQFKNLLESNRIGNVNVGFWNYASPYADLNSTDAKYYKNALERFITQNDLELTSSYSDFYRISENIRNPLEISAYNVSDNVYNHYNLKVEEGPMRKLTKAFNDVDWAIHNAIARDNIAKKERIPVFDYFFAQAIIAKFPDLQKEYNNCIHLKNGDMSAFWWGFEGKVSSFYQNNTQMDDRTFSTMITLLNTTEQKLKNGVTKKEISDALKYKINTLSSNLVYPKAVKNLQNTMETYLKFIKSNYIIDDAQELECILKLICIENSLYTYNVGSEISLYYLKIPNFITSLYNTQKNKDLFLILYNNKAFKAQQKAGQSEQQTLINLLEKNRINERIK